jgi:hypothetical protein
MRVPFSFLAPPVMGGGGGGFDPATLPLSGWWRANYTAAPWAAVASAGTSLANGDLVTNGNDPSPSAPQNGYTGPDFDGTNDNLRNLADITDFVTTTAGTLICLFRADTADNATGNTYDDAALFLDTNADFGLTFTTSGVTGFAYSGGYQAKTVACGTGGYHLVMMRINGSTLGITLDSAAESTQACGTLGVLTGSIGVGSGYGGTHHFDGRILELMVADSVLSDGDYANIKDDYVFSRYLLTL